MSGGNDKASKQEAPDGRRAPRPRKNEENKNKISQAGGRGWEAGATRWRDVPHHGNTAGRSNGPCHSAGEG